MKKIIVAFCAVFLAGCASEPPTVGFGTPRSVFIRIHGGVLSTEALTLAESYCAKYDCAFHAIRPLIPATSGH